MRHWPVFVLALFCSLLVLAFGFGCDDDDDDDSGDVKGVSKDEICNNLGELPVASGTVSGFFDFSGDAVFPITFELDADNLEYTGSLSFSDSSQSYSGDCFGDWDENGFLYGQCGAVGESDGTLVDIDLFGTIGNNGACGNWSNQFSQTGDFWLAR